MTVLKDAEYRSMSHHPLVRGVGRLMLAWAIGVMPAMTVQSVAQGLPEQSTSAQVNSAVTMKQLDEGAANKLINERASKLMRGQYQLAPALRSPKLTEDTAVPVRTPKFVADPGASARAAQQAARIEQRSREDMVRSAQSANGIATENYQRLDYDKNELNTQRVDPGVNQSTTHRANVTEVMPGFSSKKVNELNQIGAAMYTNPEAMKDIAEQNKRNLRRDGCRKTEFSLRSAQSIDMAATSAEHRVLKVEFFDIEKVAIPGTNPVEYQSVTKPSTYKRGRVDVLHPTLGGVAGIWWDRVDETYAIKYTYTPYTNPKGRNYFTYNHWLGVSYGGPVQRVLDPGMVSYGTPSDGWKTVAGYAVPYGVTAVYMSADLYQTEVTYTKPVEGVPCDPDPPEQCEVPAIGGGTIRWCPDSLGANIVLMYNDAANPNPDRYGKDVNDILVNNASRNDYTKNPDIRAAVIRGVNAGNTDLAKQLAGSCRRDTVTRIDIIQGGTYGDPDFQMCSETLVNPFPDGSKGIKRSFGLAYVGEHNFMSVSAFKKVKVAILDPMTGKQIKDADGFPLYTYRKEPINVVGPLRTDFTIMGAPTCPGEETCTTEKLPDDPRGGSEGNYLEYRHTPMGGDPKLFAMNKVYAQAGAQFDFSDYGKATNNWLPTGTVVADGTLAEIRLMAKVYNIAINEFAGGEKYMQYAADGFCKGAKLTCTDTAPTRTVGDVTFGPGLPNRGIVDLLKQWGTDSSAVVQPAYEEGAGLEPTPNGPPIKMLDDQMCWQADAEPFESCATMEVTSALKTFMRDGQKWATDCNLATDANDVPLETSPSCKRTPAKDECDNRFKGIFTGVCYNPTITYDCGVTRELKIPVTVEEQGDTCSGVMRCMGTECHRPNLTGAHGGDFARAASGMEAINQMVNEMVCAETGEPPKSVDEPCTPYVFGGRAMYCKIPIGHQIGITPNCCKEAQKGAKSAPSWMDYLSAMQGLNKVMRTQTVQRFLANSEVYGGISRTFGGVSQEVTDMYGSASNWVTDKIISPFQAGFDNLFGTQAAESSVAHGVVDAPEKVGFIEGLTEKFTQMLYTGLNDVLGQMGGTELKNMVFEKAAGGGLKLTAGMQKIVDGISTVMMVYSIAKIIGHIIFACKQEEFEWGMNDKWRLCSSAGSCCSKKIFLIGCIEKRQLYCCYKSIVSRVISEQIISKNLTGQRRFGFRTSKNGMPLGGCDINCGGFTVFELATVDWSKVDLTEWTHSLIESGLMNPADPRTNYGVSQNTLKSSMAVSKNPDEEGQFDQRVPAVKSAEVMGKSMDRAADFNHALKDEVEETCYDTDKRKMPFTYPGCRTKP